MATQNLKSYKTMSAIACASASTFEFSVGQPVSSVPHTHQLAVGGAQASIYNTTRRVVTDLDVISRAFIKFNIQFSDMLAINSATLRLWAWDSSSGSLAVHGLDTPQANAGNIVIGAAQADWVEPPTSQLSYNPAASVNNVEWRENAIPFEEITYQRANQMPVFIVSMYDSPATASYTDFDVTSIVQYWFNGGGNYGFGIRMPDENEAIYLNAKQRIATFYSQDNASTSFHPELIIDYADNTTPAKPTNLSPSGGTSLGSTAPTMSFAQDDSDINEHITSSAIQVIRSDATDFDSASTAQWYYNTYPYAWPSNSASFVYGTISAATYKPLVYGESYKWRVRTADQMGEWSPWSDTATFSVNSVPNQPSVVVNPSPTNDITTLTPTFSFTFADPDTGDTQMYGYRVVVETNSGGSVWDTGDVDITSTPVTQKTVTSTTLDWGSQYRVKARVQDQNGLWSSYSSYAYFETHKTDDPANLSPSSGATVGYTPSLYAERYQSPDLITKYDVKVRQGATSMVNLTDQTSGIQSNGVSVSYLYNGTALSSGVTYYWNMRIYSDIGGWSDWSAERAMTVVDSSVPDITSPVGANSYSTSPTVTAERAASFNAIQYQVYSSGYYDNSSGVDDAGTGALYNSGTLTSNITNPSNYVYSATIGYGSLVYNTQYKIRARVSSDSGSNWSNWCGLVSFYTDSSSPPNLVSVQGETGNPAWITSDNPEFSVTSDSDVIDELKIQVFDTSNPTVSRWDSGFVDVTNGLSASAYLSAAQLTADPMTPGYYTWNALIREASGAQSPESVSRAFILNSPPNIPTDLYPYNGSTIDSSSEPTQVFKATFDDPDRITYGDYPTAWQIEVQSLGSSGEDTPSAFDTETITSSLNAGVNSRNWPGTAFTDDIYYQYRMRFADSKSVYGSWTSWRKFIRGTPPNGTITSPTNQSTVDTATPTLGWTFTGGTQSRFDVVLQELDSAWNLVRTVASFGPFWNANTTYTIPAGYLRDNKRYKATLTVRNTTGQADPTPGSVDFLVDLDAPPAITGLDIIAVGDESHMSLSWDQGTLNAGQSFNYYKVYRKMSTETNYTELVKLYGIGNTQYKDYYAGNDVYYDYRVVTVATEPGVGVLMESPDGDSNRFSILNNVSNWTLVGADRSAGHIYDLIITDESHNRPIQQEVFETLGSSRKVIMRGFVLGYEGTLTTLWTNTMEDSPLDYQVQLNHTRIGRSLVDYITHNKGPHIIKSPFGDVWDVEFAEPQYKWLSAGHLEVQLSYVETGDTSE